MYYVYIHTLPDGRKYVGESKSPLKRWSNGDGYFENKKFYDAIIHFGWNNIKHEIVGSYHTETEAKIREAILIYMLNTEDEAVGYNQTSLRQEIIKSYAERREVGGVSLESSVPDKTVFEESGLPVSACENLIDQWVFSQRNREITKDRMLNGMTFAELQKKYNMSIRQLKNIVYESVNVIQEHM